MDDHLTVHGRTWHVPNVGYVTEKDRNIRFVETGIDLYVCAPWSFSSAGSERSPHTRKVVGSNPTTTTKVNVLEC